jgi:hypothetical protein
MDGQQRHQFKTHSHTTNIRLHTVKRNQNRMRKKKGENTLFTLSSMRTTGLFIYIILFQDGVPHGCLSFLVFVSVFARGLFRSQLNAGRAIRWNVLKTLTRLTALVGSQASGCAYRY